MKKSHPLMTGLATGAILGTAAYMLSSKPSRASQHASKSFKQNTGKALKTVGGLMENMSYMMK